MALKQTPGSAYAPDGSLYVVLADGAGNTASGSGTIPLGATQITATGTGTTNATTATLAGVAAKTTYIAGFTIVSDATAAAVGAATVTGTITGTMNFRNGTAATPATSILTQTFNPPIPASAVNTAIVVTSAAPGAGGNVAVSAWGYQL